VAIALVLLALTAALGSVGSIVAEREGRLREAEASVAASLASSQTVLGPILQRDCVESWEMVQGEGKDRKVVTERRSWKLAAARPASTSAPRSGSSRVTAASSRSTATSWTRA
jgi:inner membrane protein